MSKRRFLQRVRIIMLIAVGALLAGSAAPTLASVCTLADHIKSANTNTAVGFCPAGTSHDVITIAEDITLTEPLPSITGTITIEGGGHTISGDGKFRIFDVDGGSLTIRSATLTEGLAPSEERGGAIRLRNGAQVSLEASSIADSSALQGAAIASISPGNSLKIDRSSILRNENEPGKHAGAILAIGGTVNITNSYFKENAGGFFGGAIQSSARMDVSNTTFDGNGALAAGGVLYLDGGQATFTHVTMVGNYSNSKEADALYIYRGSFILRNSIVAGNRLTVDCQGGLTETSGNFSQDGTCGIRTGGDPLLGAVEGSPGYFPLLDGSPALDAADPRFCLEFDQIGTTRPQGGGCDIGAIESTDAIPPEPDESAICPLPDQIAAANLDTAVGNCPAGNGADTVLLLRDLTLTEILPPITSEITIEGNGHTISGSYEFLIFLVDGGRLTVNNLTLTKGKGAIKAINGGDVVVNGSRFIENTSWGGGGAISHWSSGVLEVTNSSFIDNRTEHNSTDGNGGAILAGGGLASISNSSFLNNRAEFDGGAIHTASLNGVDITNSTFADNRARRGGAVSNYGLAATITHSTMVNNWANEGASIWMYEGRVSLKLRNTIVASRFARTACVGTVAQSVGNLDADGSCRGSLSGDALLAEMIGSPGYFPLKEGSPAIGAADPRFCTETDQVGRARPVVGRCDIGAIQTSPVRHTLSDCSVTTTHGLNLRDDPSGDVIGTVRINETFAPTARTPGWFKVENQGAEGWISADYVETEGNCG